MSSDESDRAEDNSEDEPIFELSTEWDSKRTQRAMASVAGVGQADTASASHERESEDSGMDYFNGLPGTTPPHDGRFIKKARKGHKHRGSGTKKLSLGHVPKASYRDKPDLKRRPKSMVTLPHAPQEGRAEERLHHRRHTVHAVKLGRSHHHREKKTSGSSSGGYMSPGSVDEVGTKKKRKEEARKRKKDRDEKVSFREPKTSVVSFPSASDVHTADPVNVPDFGGTAHILPIDSTASLTMSLQPQLLRSVRGSSSYESFRQRRSKSDAHLSLASLTSAERQSIHCPPERKQFYRLFLKTLKYSGINSSTHSRMDGSPSGIHVPRQFSENLALQNPFGHVFDHIWLELQAFLAEKTLEEQKEWLFFQSGHIDKILTRITNFELPLYDPQRSLNSMFFGVCDREAYESLNTPAPGGSTPPNFQADDEATIVPDSAATSLTTAAPASQQDSVESKSSGNSITCDCKHDQFLSPFQMIAVRKAKELMEELEKIEALYPSCQRMGDEHPKYRTLLFRRRLESLTLWLKVTVSLADRLCALSAWLGTPVTVPEVCNDNVRPRSYSYERPPEPPEITVGSPKSPGMKPQFQVGSPDDPEQSLSFRSLQRLNSSLCRTQSSSTSSRSQGTLQRFFSNYQSASLDEDHGPYHLFIDKGLKKKGLNRLMDMLLKFMEPILKLAQFALTPLSDQDKTDDASTVDNAEERRPLLQPFLPSFHTSADKYHQRTTEYARGTSVSPESWTQEFEAMNLPLFSLQYIQLVHVPLDVMHECLRLQLVLKPPAQPSAHSVKQVHWQI